jgi:hypothetical protein
VGVFPTLRQSDSSYKKNKKIKTIIMYKGKFVHVGFLARYRGVLQMRQSGDMFSIFFWKTKKGPNYCT